jgi:hypothetical protein
MAKERLYLFDTTLRDGALLPAPSPLEGEGWGGGYFSFSEFTATSLPTAFALRASAVDLPLKGGGEERVFAS